MKEEKRPSTTSCAHTTYFQYCTYSYIYNYSNKTNFLPTQSLSSSKKKSSLCWNLNILYLFHSVYYCETFRKSTRFVRILVIYLHTQTHSQTQSLILLNLKCYMKDRQRERERNVTKVLKSTVPFLGHLHPEPLLHLSCQLGTTVTYDCTFFVQIKTKNKV